MSDRKPGEWQRIGPTTSVMSVPGGCLVREAREGYSPGLNSFGESSQATASALALCFIPYRDEALGKAMERWIEQATERWEGEK